VTHAPSARLQGQDVVIFGGSTGIGLATAHAVKQRGANITLVARNAEKLEAAARALGGARAKVADICDRQQVEAIFAGMASVDHLVITAGSLGGGRLADTDPDLLLSALHERIAGPLYAIKAALARMPNTASVVLTGGQFSDRPSPHGFSVVSAAVRGIEALARSLALELKPIRVNVISPGFVDTPLFDGMGLKGRSALLSQAANALPGGRVGRAEEVAEAILLLLTNGYMTGEVLHVDGGGRLV